MEKQFIGQVIINFLQRYSITAHDITYTTNHKGQVENLQCRIKEPVAVGIAKIIQKDFNKKFVAHDYRFNNCVLIIDAVKVMVTSRQRAKAMNL